MNWDQLKEELAKIHLSLSDHQLEQFQQYLSLLKEWNEKMNLTAIIDDEEIIEKHFYDSLKSAEVFSYDDKSLLDVGSGAGFPGIPLKIMFPDLFVTLLEPTGKRVTFLNEVIHALSLKQIVTVNMRAEDYVKEARSYYDIVTARAVSQLPILVELCAPLLRVNGTFIALKGMKGKEEHLLAEHALQELCLSLEQEQEWELGKGDHRINLFYKKVKENPMKYPRPYGQMKKKPL